MLRREFCTALICAFSSNARSANRRAFSSEGAKVFDVTRYGATGNGQLDCTAQIQRAIHAAASKEGDVYLPQGIYLVRGVAAVRGLRGIHGPGVLRGSSSTAEGVLIAKGLPNDPLKGLRLQVSIDCGVSKRGIFLQNTIDSRIEGTRITNVAVDGGDGIRIHLGCQRLAVVGCHITCAKDSPYGTYREGLHGIRVVGETTSPTAGFLERGEFARPRVTTTTHQITGNTVFNGTHGIEIFGASDVWIKANRCIGQSHRNIICSPSAARVHIEENELQECGSSAIHCAFGAREIVMRSNRIRSSSVLKQNDAAAIQMYMGCTQILAQENDVEGNFTYGIHGSFATTECRWLGNRLRIIGGLALAGLSVESDWTMFPAGQRPFTRARRSPGLRIASEPTSTFQLEGNQIEGPVCGISLAQIQRAPINNIQIRNNIIRLGSKRSRRVLACIEDRAGTLQNIVFSQNYTDAWEQKTPYLLTRGHEHFTEFAPAAPIR